MKRIWKEPLLHFLVLGALLVAVYATARPDTSERGNVIEINDVEIALLTDRWTKQWGRSPTSEELLGLVDARIREEVLYRQALQFGLDEGDEVLRRRMVQKLEFLISSAAVPENPADAVLRSFFRTRAEDYRDPARWSFTHVYFNPDRPGVGAEEAAGVALETLRSRRPVPTRAPELGDRFMLQYDYSHVTARAVDRMFGARFGQHIEDLPAGEWLGPILSGYGWHLVRIGDRTPSRVPTFEEVAPRVRIDYIDDAKSRARDLAYQAARETYDIRIDEAALAKVVTSTREP